MRAFHSDAISYDHTDPEYRRSTLKFNLWKCELDHDLVANDQAVALDDNGCVTLNLTDEDAITLYEALRQNWQGYVNEMRAAEAAVASGTSLAHYIGDWRAAREADMDAYLPTDPKHPHYDPTGVWDNREK